MQNVNPTGLVFIGFLTVVGYLCGSWAWGLTVALGAVIAVELWIAWDGSDPVSSFMRYRRGRKRFRRRSCGR